MSVVPDQWSHPDSTPGLLYDLGWCILTTIVFGAVLYRQPVFVELSLNATRVAGPIVIGAVFGIGVVALSATDLWRRFWSKPRRRFSTTFAIILTIQAFLAIAHTWTILSVFVSSLVAIPARLCTFILSNRSHHETV